MIPGSLLVALFADASRTLFGEWLPEKLLGYDSDLKML